MWHFMFLCSTLASNNDQMRCNIVDLYYALFGVNSPNVLTRSDPSTTMGLPRIPKLSKRALSPVELDDVGIGERRNSTDSDRNNAPITKVKDEIVDKDEHPHENGKVWLRQFYVLFEKKTYKSVFFCIIPSWTYEASVMMVTVGPQKQSESKPIMAQIIPFHCQECRAGQVPLVSSRACLKVKMTIVKVGRNPTRAEENLEKRIRTVMEHQRFVFCSLRQKDHA